MKERLLVDLDGCLVDLNPTWLRLYGDATEHYIHPDSILHYDFRHMTNPVVRDQRTFWDCLPQALKEAPPVAGSSIFSALCDAYDTYVVTFCHPSAPNAMAIKQRWMADWFPAFDRQKMVFTAQKHIVSGDWLIEDNPMNVSMWEAHNPNGGGLLVKQPYNTGVEWEKIGYWLGV